MPSFVVGIDVAEVNLGISRIDIDKYTADFYCFDLRVFGGAVAELEEGHLVSVVRDFCKDWSELWENCLVIGIEKQMSTRYKIIATIFHTYFRGIDIETRDVHARSWRKHHDVEGNGLPYEHRKKLSLTAPIMDHRDLIKLRRKFNADNLMNHQLREHTDAFEAALIALHAYENFDSIMEPKKIKIKKKQPKDIVEAIKLPAIQLRRPEERREAKRLKLEDVGGSWAAAENNKEDKKKKKTTTVKKGTQKKMKVTKRVKKVLK